MPRSSKTTAPAAASTIAPDSIPPCLALVIAWSESQPHRVGEVAFFPFGERLFVGRGDDDLDRFAHFVRQRPGETPAVDPHEEVLAGETLSRRLLEVRSGGNQLEVEVIGNSPTYVNGAALAKKAKTTLRPGDTVLFKGELLLLCVLRPRTLVRPPGLRELHPFGEPDADGIVGESPAAWTLRAQLATAAAMRDHVLIQGESGTGKELAAAFIKNHSRRAGGPMITANAKAIPETLMASELFGNLRGYPSPEMPARPGLVGAADGGTLLLDEIGELTRDAQAQMLRVLDKGERLVLGDSNARRVDLRLVGATNRDDYAFRADFLARLKVRVHLPPLRERREDIPLLVRHLLLARAGDDKRLKSRLRIETPGGRLEPRVSAHLIAYLLHHPLPTNVRQIENILADAILVGGDEKLTVPPNAPKLDTLVAPKSSASAAPSLLPPPKVSIPRGRLPREAPTREVLKAHLLQHRGKVARVAKDLDMSRAALYRLMDNYGIDRDPEEPE